MRHIIQFYIYKGEKQYIAEGIELSIVTQGKTLDELVKNIQEALEVHLHGEDLEDFGLAKHPSVLLNFELPTWINAQA